MPRRFRFVGAGLAGTLLVACGQPLERMPHPLRYVFVIVMENKSAEEALTGPFTASLAAKYGVAGNYHPISHPSVPNYLALTSGSTRGLRDARDHPLPKQCLGTHL